MGSDRMSVGFVGGGPRWLIEAVRQETSELWEGRDELLDRSAPDRKIWATTYLRIATGRLPDERLPRSPGQISADLAVTLSQARQLAPKIQMEQFVPSFAAAEAALTADPPVGTDYYASLAGLFPFDLTHRQLLAAVEQAWVFGAMGSWNDVGQMDGPLQVRYDTLSEKLFALLCEAILSVANSTFATDAQK